MSSVTQPSIYGHAEAETRAEQAASGPTPILTGQTRSIWYPALIAMTLTLAVLLLVFRDTAWSMIAIWIRSETFAHGFLIVPMSAWMIWSKRAELAQQVPRPCWPALLLLAGAGLVWLVGQSAGVLAVGQAALVGMMVGLVWAVLGTAVAKTILFPLGFLFFMVPVGDFLMDPLMDHTANFVVLALRLSGIPVFREGNHFSIPSGEWSVVEACSGLRYLIASITLGCLFAYLSYRTLWRRAAFIVASLLVPVIANWVRAYLIVIIAHLSSNKLATGVDHLIYGWVFFGLVMLLLFWVGSIWREDSVEALPAALPIIPAPVQTSAASPRALILVAVTALAVTLVWHPALSVLANVSPDHAPQLMPLSLVSSGGLNWSSEGESLTAWTPHYLKPRAVLNQTFSRSDNSHNNQIDPQKIGIFIGYYNRQRQYDELVTYNNQTVIISDKNWFIVGEQSRHLQVNDQSLDVVEAQVRGSAQRLLTWKWYWINGRWTNNDYVAKALIALSMLSGHGDDSAVIIVYTPTDAFQTEEAAQRLQGFTRAALPQIEQRLQTSMQASTQVPKAGK